VRAWRASDRAPDQDDNPDHQHEADAAAKQIGERHAPKRAEELKELRSQGAAITASTTDHA
jgi:hypothetical protein